jgi:hypothetical protein
MAVVRVAGVFIVAAVMAAPAGADVTLKRKNDGKMMMGSMAGTGVQYIKGARMRDDQTVGGNETSTIIDVGAQQMVSLNHKRREALVYDMTKLSADLAKIPMSDIKTKVTPTTITRQIAGHACTVYNMEATVPMEMGGEKLIFLLSGPACLAKNGPGHADFATLYTTAAEKGFFFGDPRAAKAQPGQARGMTAMYREMAGLGVPLAQEINIKFEGSGPMAGMMSKMGGSSMTSEVVSVSTDPIPDSTFEIPAGYKVVKQ